MPDDAIDPTASAISVFVSRRDAGCPHAAKSQRNLDLVCRQLERTKKFSITNLHFDTLSECY